MSETLMVIEIYRSLQGEGLRAGLPCTLVRLAGCALRCRWCDTRYARAEAGEEMTADEIVERVADLGCPRVELTGGEPLDQPAAPGLLQRFCQAGWETLLETNGSRDISLVDPRVARIVDVKCPSSGQADRMHWGNLDALTGRDEVKFVLAGRADFDYAREVVAAHGLIDRCPVVFSPVADELTPARLAEWILATDLDVRLGLQLHKIVWPGTDRGV